jgi:hypothetical protein
MEVSLKIRGDGNGEWGRMKERTVGKLGMEEEERNKREKEGSR